MVLPPVDDARALELLRAHEPVVRFTRGERFLPMPVEPYVRQCSLWVDTDDGEGRLVVAAGSLDVHRLTEVARRSPRDHLHLRYVQKPMDVATLKLKGVRLRERPPGLSRLGAVGLLARFVDHGLRASLLLRGNVPGATGATAQVQYGQAMGDRRECTYYGRIVRDGGYLCLQYWFFYAMNDWRSAFAGINEHESDWEMVTVYLSDPDADAGAAGEPRPQWVAFSSHDYTGDDLRRRWDDPELRRVGDHPVVFAGAGSHSGAFVPGDYLVQIQPRGRAGRVVDFFDRVSTAFLPWIEDARPGVGVPFVDYHRGDGESVGPGEDRGWDAVVIGDDTPWVRDFRGLWGLDTRDRLGGERAPAGPRYERHGAVRTSWQDPVGWAGLHKVAPSADLTDDLLRERVEEIDGELAALEQRVEQARDDLRRHRVVALTLDQAGSEHLAERRAGELAEEERAVAALVARRGELRVERDVHAAALREPVAVEPPQSHLRHKHEPYEPGERVRERFLAVWSTLSAPLMLGSVVALLFLPLSPLLLVVPGAVLLFLSVEAFARKRLLAFLRTVLVLVVVLTLLYLALWWFVDNWRIGLGVLVGGTALALLLSSLRDLRRR
ncbi:MAG TPA: hypothetical protein VK894_12945 [Jiangellales bacterium]|nr:hypothetical protein [Jiangellales bacterium]